jgi:hypothetical protein
MAEGLMSSSALKVTASANHEERSRQAIIAAVKRINARGHDVVEAEGRVGRSAAELADHEERNPDLLKVHSSTIVRHFVFLFGLICVYGIDVLLFGATAEYVASLITGSTTLMLLAKYGVPLFFLGIEVLISLKIIDAREASEASEASEEVDSYGW